MKLNKKQIRTLPIEVATRILESQARYRTRNCNYHQESPGWELYLAEGVTYSAFDDKGNPLKTIHMQSSRTLHAGGGWQSHRIGSKIPIPQGNWIVAFRFFMGDPKIDVHHVGPHQIGE